jgi:hypothetical protein
MGSILACGPKGVAPVVAKEGDSAVEEEPDGEREEQDA